MKLKKLIKVMRPAQAIRFTTNNGNVTKRSEVTELDSCYFLPLFESLKEYKVDSIRCVHDDLLIPDYRDYIEIKLIGENDNDIH